MVATAFVTPQFPVWMVFAQGQDRPCEVTMIPDEMNMYVKRGYKVKLMIPADIYVKASQEMLDIQQKIHPRINADTKVGSLVLYDNGCRIPDPQTLQHLNKAGLYMNKLYTLTSNEASATIPGFREVTVSGVRIAVAGLLFTTVRVS